MPAAAHCPDPCRNPPSQPAVVNLAAMAVGRGGPARVDWKREPAATKGEVMTGALYRLGSGCARRPWRVIVVWLMAIAVLAGLTAALGGTYRDDSTAPGTSSARADARIAASLPQQAGAEAHIVARWPGRPNLAAVTAARRGLQALSGVRTVQQRTSADG